MIYSVKENNLDSSDVYGIITLVGLLFLSGIFSSAETALTTVNKLRIRTLAEEGNKRAITLLSITEDTSKLLTTILIGNNIVNLSASALATTLAIKLGGNNMVGIGTGILTLFILIFGEITPKTLATIHAERMSLFYTLPISLLMKILTPIINIVNGLALGFMLLLRVDPNAKNDALTENELRTIVDAGHEDGVLEEDEKEMIQNVFDLGEVKAKDVMVPRVHVTFASVDNNYDELIEIYREDKFTRLPVYEETTDNVIGTINMKDLLLAGDCTSFKISDIMREAYFTYEHKSISELLVEMKKSSFNMAVVLDEYGETAGLITLEDLLEEIVGEIHDEYDEKEEDRIKQIGEREYLVEGSLSLDDLNDELDLDEVQLELTSQDHDSIGGLFIELLERIPEENDEVITNHGVKLVVKELDKNRIESIIIALPEEPINLDFEEN